LFLQGIELADLSGQGVISLLEDEGFCFQSINISRRPGRLRSIDWLYISHFVFRQFRQFRLCGRLFFRLLLHTEELGGGYYRNILFVPVCLLSHAQPHGISSPLTGTPDTGKAQKSFKVYSIAFVAPDCGGGYAPAPILRCDTCPERLVCSTRLKFRGPTKESWLHMAKSPHGPAH
jgi:hypothetical protein